jgi:hypothetical protein
MDGHWRRAAFQQRDPPEGIVKSGRRQADDPETPVDVHKCVALQAGEFFPAVVLARGRRLGRLRRLRIDDRRGRLRLTPRLHAIERDEDCVQSLEQRSAGEAPELTVDCLPSRKSRGSPPHAARADIGLRLSARK